MSCGQELEVTTDRPTIGARHGLAGHPQGRVLIETSD
jgi:hypothetical protein